MQPVGNYIKISPIPEPKTVLITSPVPNQKVMVLAVSPDIDNLIVEGDIVLCPKGRFTNIEGEIFIDIEFIIGKFQN